MKKISEIRVNLKGKDHFQTRESQSGVRSAKNMSPSKISHEETKVDDPKTSEYAFYKRLKGGMGRNFHFHNLDGQLKKVEASYFSGEVGRLVNYGCEKVRPQFPVEKVTPTDLRASLWLGEASKDPGPQNSHKEVFSRKRWKLRWWVAEASSLEIDEFSSKGYDVVSMLLQHLVTQSNASKSCMPPRSRYEELNTRSHLFASTDMHFRKLPWTPSMNYIEPIAGQNLIEDSSELWSNKPIVVTSSQWDIKGRYCASDDENVTMLHTNMKPDWDTYRDFLLKINRSLAQNQMHVPSKLECSSQKSFSSLWHLPNQSVGPSNNLSFSKLDEFHDPHDCALGIENHTQFLDWNNGAACNTVVKLSPIRTIVLRDEHDMTSLLDFWSERSPCHSAESSIEEPSFVNFCLVIRDRLLGNYNGNNFNYPETHNTFMREIFREMLCPSAGTLVLLLPELFGLKMIRFLCMIPFIQVSTPLLHEEKTKWSLNNSSETEMQSHTLSLPRLPFFFLDIPCPDLDTLKPIPCESN
ncbi:hypothetical protein NE237_012524 [Protea cynaroides]|uniref:Uncharacterized protein n=1 Tax=Protea cynaroides TaxID=273540 RepID=A0A9Q0JXP6_9MAGN|nr:hypothetical protein NE237_012524 [Protea cynaroides]